jgi:hypothetical protein
MFICDKGTLLIYNHEARHHMCLIVSKFILLYVSQEGKDADIQRAAILKKQEDSDLSEEYTLAA